ELRLAGISTIAETNRCLEETYLPKMNGRFSRPAASPEDAHDPLGKTDLGEIMCMERERSVDNDYVVRFQTRLFQIMKTGKPPSLPRTR
ncbi:MAG: ISNCY family transposase, partial [Treponema sp.]|nr:ISNCY family transposase [Treponema sp.]